MFLKTVVAVDVVVITATFVTAAKFMTRQYYTLHPSVCHVAAANSRTKSFRKPTIDYVSCNLWITFEVKGQVREITVLGQICAIVSELKAIQS